MSILIGGWCLAVAALFIAIVRPWRPTHAWPLLPLLASAGAAAWALWNGATVYADMMAQHSWTAATIIIPYAPTKALVFALLAYFAVRSLLSLRTSAEKPPGRYAVPAFLTAVTLLLVINDIASAATAARERMARNPDLSTAQLNAEIERINAGKAARGEILAFLENPLCPPSLLQHYAATETLFKTQVARNPKVPTEIIRQLSKDSDSIVRLYAAASGSLPEDELPRLAADTDPSVRETIAWKKNLPDEDFARLAADSVPRVRSTVAVQPRLSDADLLRLTMDPDESVRANATRMAIQRGLQE